MNNTNDTTTPLESDSVVAPQRRGRRVSSRALAMMAATVAVVGVSASVAAALPDTPDGQNEPDPASPVEVPVEVPQEIESLGTDVDWGDPALDAEEFGDWGGEWGNGDGWDDCPGCGLG